MAARSVARIGGVDFFTELPGADGTEYSVGQYCRLDDGRFGRISVMWTEKSGERKATFVELLLLQRPEQDLPYHGPAGLELLVDEYHTCRFASLRGKIVVEDMATFRRRDAASFGPDVFYICDYVDKQRGLRHAEAPFKSQGPQALRVQRHVAHHVSPQEVEGLKVVRAPAPSASARAESPVKTSVLEPEEMVRAYQMVRHGDSRRRVPVLSEREAAPMPKADLPLMTKQTAARGGGKCDLFVVDSEEEREKMLVEKGIVAEKIDSEGSPDLPAKSDMERSKVVLGSPAKKLHKKRLKLESSARAASPPPPKKLSAFDLKRQKTFKFLEERDDDEAWAMESYSSSDDDFFVEDEDEKAAHLPANFRAMSLKEAFSLWLEFVFFCENDPLFRKRVDADPDNVYSAAVASVDKKIKAAAEMLGSGGHWNAATRNKLLSWTELQSRDVRAMPGRKCDLCGKTLGEGLYSVHLYGQYYDGDLFWDEGILNVRKKAVAEEICVGESCMQKAVLFHKLKNFKLRALSLMNNAGEQLVKKDPSLKGDRNAKALTDKIIDRCAERLLAEMTSLIDKAVGKELAVGRKSAKQI